MNHTKKKQGTKIERQTSVFAATANAFEWVEAHRRDFGTPRGAFAMTKPCGSASEWCRTVGIASASEGLAGGKQIGVKGPP